jgi:hypothetical protein
VLITKDATVSKNATFSPWEYFLLDRERKLLINVAAIIVGVLASLAIVLQQDYLNNLRVIGRMQILILFGIGAGIETAKRVISERVISK